MGLGHIGWYMNVLTLYRNTTTKWDNFFSDQQYVPIILTIEHVNVNIGKKPRIWAYNGHFCHYGVCPPTLT